jgi:hypothetical protein
VPNLESLELVFTDDSGDCHLLPEIRKRESDPLLPGTLPRPSLR